MASENGDKAKFKVPVALAIVSASAFIYVGKMEMRVESLETSRTEIDVKMDKLLAKVEDIRVHLAAMDRRAGGDRWRPEP